MEFPKWIVVAFFAFLALTCLIGPFAYYHNHPEMTQMEVLQMFWVDHTVGLLCAAAACLVAVSELD